MCVWRRASPKRIKIPYGRLNWTEPVKVDNGQNPPLMDLFSYIRGLFSTICFYWIGAAEKKELKHK